MANLTAVDAGIIIFFQKRENRLFFVRRAGKADVKHVRHAPDVVLMAVFCCGIKSAGSRIKQQGKGALDRFGSFCEVVRISDTVGFAHVFHHAAGAPVEQGFHVKRAGFADGIGEAVRRMGFLNVIVDQTVFVDGQQEQSLLEIGLPFGKQRQKGFRFDICNNVFDFLDAGAKASVLCAYTGAGILTPNEARISLSYPESDDPAADKLSQRGGTGLLGDSATNEGGEGKTDDS